MKHKIIKFKLKRVHLETFENFLTGDNVTLEIRQTSVNTRDQTELKRIMYYLRN